MTEGRDEKGRFVKGNNANPSGRPRRQTEELYLDALVSCVKVSEWKEIVARAIRDAKRGDDRARRWLSDYLIGKPTEYVNADLTSAGEALKVNIYIPDNGRDGH